MTTDTTIYLVAGVATWIALAVTVAEYGRGRGHPWWPVFIAALFLGFPLPLLLVAIVPRGDR